MRRRAEGLVRKPRRRPAPSWLAAAQPMRLSAPRPAHGQGSVQSRAVLSFQCAVFACGRVQRARFESAVAHLLGSDPASAGAGRLRRSCNAGGGRKPWAPQPWSELEPTERLPHYHMPRRCFSLEDAEHAAEVQDVDVWVALQRLDKRLELRLRVDHKQRARRASDLPRRGRAGLAALPAASAATAACAATASFFYHADVLSWPTRSQEVRSQYDRCLPPASSPVRLHLSSQLLHSCFHFRLPPAVALSRWYG